MRRGICLAAALIAVIGMLVLAIGRLNSLLTPAVNTVIGRQDVTLVLDAGHGGEDGGAISLTGVPESQINLAIVLKLRDMLGFYGVNPVLLRETDTSLHDDNASTLREKKRSDLENRAATAEATEGATLISIHQNTYTSSRYHGAQVFFAPTDGSQELAVQLQAAIQSALQPDNQRAAKQIPESVYLMNHITCPAVLIECGFLTNPEEEARLRDDGYQKQLAAVLTSALLSAESDLQLDQSLL